MNNFCSELSAYGIDTMERYDDIYFFYAGKFSIEETVLILQGSDQWFFTGMK